jgi:hypothetical protein
MNYYDNSASGSRDRQTDRQTDLAKLTVAFCNFTKAPETSQLVLCREIIAVCSEIHTKHINTLCGQNGELLNVKLVGFYSRDGVCLLRGTVWIFICNSGYVFCVDLRTNSDYFPI